jgi:hypothetical protein|nr:hypothetical protein [uncultured Romboutsia sp.]
MSNNKPRKHNLKFTLQGFNQLEAIKLGLNNDDLTVLRWFIDFKNTGEMEKNYIPSINDMGHWVNYSTLVDSLPILLKDGNKYLEEYLELEKAYYKLDEDSYKKLRKKYMEKYLKKVQRILSGNLSKVLKRDLTKLGEEKGTKVYLYVDEEAYKKLISNTNMNDFLRDNGVQYTQDKSVQYTQDKSVQSDSSTNDSSTNDSSTTQSEQNVPVVETNKELIESKTHLLLDSKNKIDKVAKWNKDRLVKAIDIFVEQGGQYFSLLEKIYKDDKNFAPKEFKVTNNQMTQSEVIYKPNRAHNVNNTFLNYTPEELEKLLQESQKNKFK